ncbi:MAG: hypothetical protein AAF517_06670, partial [Planctomycetota bacterium]
LGIGIGIGGYWYYEHASDAPFVAEAPNLGTGRGGSELARAGGESVDALGRRQGLDRVRSLEGRERELERRQLEATTSELLTRVESGAGSKRAASKGAASKGARLSRKGVISGRGDSGRGRVGPRHAAELSDQLDPGSNALEDSLALKDSLAVQDAEDAFEGDAERGELLKQLRVSRSRPVPPSATPDAVTSDAAVQERVTQNLAVPDSAGPKVSRPGQVPSKPGGVLTKPGRVGQPRDLATVAPGGAPPAVDSDDGNRSAKRSKKAAPSKKGAGGRSYYYDSKSIPRSRAKALDSLSEHVQATEPAGAGGAGAGGRPEENDLAAAFAGQLQRKLEQKTQELDEALGFELGSAVTLESGAVQNGAVQNGATLEAEGSLETEQLAERTRLASRFVYRATPNSGRETGAGVAGQSVSGATANDGQTIVQYEFRATSPESTLVVVSQLLQSKAAARDFQLSEDTAGATLLGMRVPREKFSEFLSQLRSAQVEETKGGLDVLSRPATRSLTLTSRRLTPTEFRDLLPHYIKRLNESGNNKGLELAMRNDPQLANPRETYSEGALSQPRTRARSVGASAPETAKQAPATGVQTPTDRGASASRSATGSAASTARKSGSATPRLKRSAETKGAEKAEAKTVRKNAPVQDKSAGDEIRGVQQQRRKAKPAPGASSSSRLSGGATKEHTKKLAETKKRDPKELSRIPDEEFLLLYGGSDSRSTLKYFDQLSAARQAPERQWIDVEIRFLRNVASPAVASPAAVPAGDAVPVEEAAQAAPAKPSAAPAKSAPARK